MTAALPRRHGLEVLALPVEDAGARRAEQLVTREAVEVAVERAHVDAQVRNRLRSVDHHRGAARVREANDLVDGRHRAQHVRDMGDGDEARARRQQGPVAREIDLAARVERDGQQPRPALRAQHLPGHEIRVVLEPRRQHLVTGPDPEPPERLRDQVHRLGGAAREHDLGGVGGAEKATHGVAHALEPLRGGDAERVHGAVDVGGVTRVDAAHGLQHGVRLLRGRGAVEVDQRMAVHALRQRRELRAHPRHVDRERAGHRHRHAGHDLRPATGCRVEDAAAY